MFRPFLLVLSTTIFLTITGSLPAAPKTPTQEDEATALLKAGKNKEAVEKLNNALRKTPKNPYLLNDRGLAFRGDQQFDRAIADFDASLRFGFKPAWVVYLNRGYAYLSNGKSKLAVDDFTKALKLVPKAKVAQVDLLIALAHAYFDQQKSELALKHLNRAIKLGVIDADPYILRGILHKVGHDYALSLADYEKAITLEPKNPRAYDVEAYLLSTCPMPKFRDGQKAIRYATKACELSDWKDARTLATLADAYAETGNFDQAIKCENKAVAIDAKDADNSHLELFRQKLPVRDLNRKESAVPTVSKIKDRIAISFGKKTAVRFKMENGQHVHPEVVSAGKAEPQTLWLDYHEEKGKRVLLLRHSFRRTLRARCLARLHGYDTYFETDILPVPVRTINPELWSEPIDELVIFAFELTGEEAPPPDENADSDVARVFPPEGRPLASLP